MRTLCMLLMMYCVFPAVMGRLKVHEVDIVNYYPLLKEYLLEFACNRLPDLEKHKVPVQKLLVQKL